MRVPKTPQRALQLPRLSGSARRRPLRILTSARKTGLVGDGAPATCRTEGWGARAGAGGKVEEMTTEKGAIFMEEAEVEGVGKQPVGEEVKLVGEKLEVGAEAHEGLGPLNLVAQVWTRWQPSSGEREAVSVQADRAYLRLERSSGRRRQLYLVPESDIIQNISGFWVTAFLRG